MKRLLFFLTLLLSFLSSSVAQTVWTNRQSNSGEILNDVVFTGDAFIVVGTATAPVTVLTSPDGITWTRRTVEIGGIFNAVAYGDGRAVAVGTTSGASIAAVSTDNGQTWDGGPTGIGLYLDGVTWTGSEFVAVGGTGPNGNAVIATSPDGETWTGGPLSFASDLKDIISVGTTRVAVGWTGAILYSLDGGDWTAAPNIPNVDWEGVTYAAGNYLVVGVQGQLMTSPDGITWTLGNSGRGDNLFGATSIESPEVWVTVGANGRIIVSNDASNWSTILPAPSGAILNGVTYGVPSGSATSLFVAVGNLGQILTSPGPEIGGGGGTPATFVDDSLNVPSNSSQFSAQVTASETVSWTAAAGTDWIFLSNKTGTGNGTVTGTLQANNSAQPRTGSVSIGTDTLVIEQAGADLTPPSFLSASYSEADGGIQLNWGGVFAAEAFVIERRDGDEGIWETVLTVDNNPTTNAVDDTIIKGNSYQYRIRSVSGELVSDWSSPVQGASPPDIPDDFSATPRNASQIELRWTDVNGETGYTIGRATGEGFFDIYINLPANETRYIDVGLDPETVYKYTIEAVSTVFSGPSPEVSASTPSETRTIVWGESRFASQDYHGVAHGNGATIAVGDDGRITRSTDLQTWVEIDSGVDVTLWHIHFANNLFVAVGDEGVVLWSADGTSWTSATSPTSESLAAVSYLNNWYAVGKEGGLISSSDGNTWTALTSPAESGFVDLFAGPKLVAIESTGRFLTSEDGSTWTQTRADGPPDATEPFFWTRTAGAFGDGKYGVVGPASYTSTSTDASTWTEYSSQSFQYFNAVAFGNGRFVAVAGRTGYSLDGQTYLAGNDPPKLLNAITHTGNVFVAVGRLGVIVTSLDGVTWTEVHEPEGTDAGLREIASSGSQLVIYGSRFNNSGFQEAITLTNSLDGTGWSQEKPLEVNGSNWERSLNDLRYLNGQFVMVGENSAIFTSSDGNDFVARNAEEGFSGQFLQSVAYADGTYLAAGLGTEGLFESTDDGVTWNPINDLPNGFSAPFLDYANRWSGGSGSFFSEDGFTWEMTRVNGFGSDMQAGVLGSQGGAPLFVNVGQGFSGTSASVSWDGRNWTLRAFESVSQPSAFFSAIAYGAGVFVATSETPNESGDSVWASIDGIRWKAAPEGFFAEGVFNSGGIADITFNTLDNTFYGVGSNGLIIQMQISSSDFIPPGPQQRLNIGLVGDMIKLEWPAYPDFNYLLRFNDGLDSGNWVPIGSPEVGDGSIKTYQVSVGDITIPRFWSLLVEENQ